jgi:hypothetical protein
MSKEYYQKNKERIQKKQQEYYQKNKEKVSEKGKLYRERKKKEDPLYVKKNNERLYSYAHSENGKVNRKKTYDKYNKSEKRREYAKNWIKEKSKNDLGYKLNLYVGHRIREALKVFGLKKNKKRTIEFFNYNLEELKEHLEKQFDNKMSWDNYGKWHIDHIIPVKLYDLNKKNNIEKCWSLKNLRPLMKEENLKKKDNILLYEVEKYNLYDILPDEIWLI